MPTDRPDAGATKQLNADRVAGTWKTMLTTMLVFLPINMLMPCACVLHQYDPRPLMFLVVAASWLYHLYHCARARRLLPFLRGLSVGCVSAILAFYTTPICSLAM